MLRIVFEYIFWQFYLKIECQSERIPAKTYRQSVAQKTTTAISRLRANGQWLGLSVLTRPKCSAFLLEVFALERDKSQRQQAVQRSKLITQLMWHFN